MLLIVSVIVCVVSVWLVMEPCVKFGTTGTARAAAGIRLTPTADIAIYMIVFPKWVIANLHQSITVISLTNCPVAVLPAPPAVTPITPAEVIVPASDPATPAV